MDPAREPAPSVVRQLEELAGRLHRRLIAEASEATASSDRDERIGELISRAAPLLDAAGRARLHEAIDRLACGLGPLEPLLADPEVDEILVMGTAPVFVERCGRLAPAGVRFADEATLRGAIDRILGPAGRRVDESSPFCDARLPDGSRVNVVIPPLAVDGPVLTIRRFRSGGLTAKDLESSGTWPPRIGALLAEAIRSRANVLVSGGTGAGKTTVLSALAGLVDPGERVIVIEDTTELAIALPHVVRLQARPSNVEGRGAITIHDLVRNALRMRPDRIIVGEVRGGEALDMVMAMSTGHDGCLSTIHASSPQAALGRLEALCLMSGVDLPHAAIASLIVDGLDLIVHQERGPDGRRRVARIAHVVSGPDGPVAVDVTGGRLPELGR